jgi:hypothetical protein
MHYRDVDGVLISGKNSGTHWLKYMLSHALAAQHGLPPPRHSSGPTADDFIGHPRWPQRHDALPRIGSSHNLPSRLFAWGPVRRCFDLPPTVVLVRDVKQAMLSHYVKWRHKLDLPLSDYVRTALPGRRKLTDVWWYLEFFNRWGAMAQAYPDKIAIVRYEDLLAEPVTTLYRVVDHYRLLLDDAAIQAALAAADRARMRQRLDPGDDAAIIPGDEARTSVQLDAEDDAYLTRVLAEHLKFEFGYGYAQSERSAVMGQAAARSERITTAPSGTTAIAEAP